MTYRAAVCTSDGHTIDLHFGETRCFLVIEIDEPDGAWKEIEYREAPLRMGKVGHDEKWLSSIVGLLSDVEYVWTNKIGPKPHRVLLAAGISALEVPSDVEGAVKALQRYRNRSRPKGGGVESDGIPL